MERIPKQKSIIKQMCNFDMLYQSPAPETLMILSTLGAG